MQRARGKPSRQTPTRVKALEDLLDTCRLLKGEDHNRAELEIIQQIESLDRLGHPKPKPPAARVVPTPSVTPSFVMAALVAVVLIPPLFVVFGALML